MAFQRRQQQGGGDNKPIFSAKLSVKQGNGYIQGPSIGFWPNEQGGPAYRGTLKGDMLAQVIEFLVNAHEANLSVPITIFDNRRQGGFKQQPGGGGFKQGGFAPKKPNPFKPQQQDENPFDGN